MITEEECENIGLLKHFAGMIDCDGNIGIYAHIYTNSYYQRIRFGNTNIKLIEWIVENIGGKIPKEYVRDNPKHKNSYDWQLSGSNSYKILKKIRPYLIIKQEQADLAIELYEKVSNQNYSSISMPNHKKELAKELYERCKSLNKRGKSDEEIEIIIPVKIRKDLLDEWLE